MSTAFWQDQIRQALERLCETSPAARIAVVGVGHELRGDDAVGVLLAQRLRHELAANERVLIVEAGPVPENFSGALRRFGPDLVLVIDAAQMGEAPGTARWLEWKDVSRAGVSTHTASLQLFNDYLARELGCKVALLGIQTADLSLDAPLSPIVQRALEQVSALLIELLSKAVAGVPVNFTVDQCLLSEIVSSEGVWD